MSVRDKETFLLAYNVLNTATRSGDKVSYTIATLVIQALTNKYAKKMGD